MENSFYRRARQDVSDLEPMADREGFEPPEPVKARHVSSVLVSTTHPPIRNQTWRGTRESNSAILGLESSALPIEPVPRGGKLRSPTPICYDAILGFEASSRALSRSLPH